MVEGRPFERPFDSGRQAFEQANLQNLPPPPPGGGVGEEEVKVLIDA